MSQYFPLCFEIVPKRSVQDSTRQSEFRKDILQSQQQVVRSISRFGSRLTFSLRYFYDPYQSPKIKTYLLINQARESQPEESYEQVFSLLTKGNLSQFLNLNPEAEFSQIQKLDWVQVIGEVLKHEELIETQNYYLPHLFEANSANDMLAVYDVMNRLDSRLILEITLQPYQNSHEKSFWVNAINQMITQLNQVNASASGNKDNLLSLTLALYQKYQQLYSNGELFKYCIKTLAENRGDASVVLETLIEHATKETPHSKQSRIFIVKRDETGFLDSLQATENIDIANAIEWEKWESNFGQRLIKEAIKPKKVGLAKFSDDSLTLSNLFSSPHVANPTQNQNQPREYDAVLGDSALAKFSSSPSPSRIVDLKPLHRLATSQEISGFFRIAIPVVTPNASLEETTNKLPEKLTIEDVIGHYGELITEDTYIVGIDEDGKPCISNFSKIPHRIVAGTTGTGKTNFLNSMIYQFLYAGFKANAEREIYIADFKAGIDYYRIARRYSNVKLLTKAEELASLLANLWQEYERRLEKMIDEDVESLQELREKCNSQEHRIILVIDEAASILNAERKSREEIYKYLQELAAKSRVTGIHIFYCSQRPTPDVIPRIISDNMDERVIFRVFSSASQLLLDDDAAAELPVEPKGRAIYRGLEPELKLVATPYVPKNVWDNPFS